MTEKISKIHSQGADATRHSGSGPQEVRREEAEMHARRLFHTHHLQGHLGAVGRNSLGGHWRVVGYHFMVQSFGGKAIPFPSSQVLCDSWCFKMSQHVSSSSTIQLLMLACATWNNEQHLGVFRSSCLEVPLTIRPKVTI